MSSPQFRFNPLTGKLDISSEGGGPSGNSTFILDEGANVSGSTFHLTGTPAGQASPMTTVNENGFIGLENRTWVSQYIVDTNTDPGLRGTFSTIQSALDAAVVDGMTSANPKIIQLRNGAYIEDLAIPGGACFSGSIPTSDPSNYVAQVSITGNHVIDDLASIYCNGVIWITEAGDTFTSGDTSLAIVVSNSSFMNTSSGLFVKSTADITQLVFESCKFTSNGNQTEQFSITGNVDSYFISCQFGVTAFDVTGGILRFYQCDQVGEIDLHNAIVLGYNSTFYANNDDNITTDGTATSCVLVNCLFSGDFTNYAIGGAGANEVRLINCSINPQSSGPKDFVDPSVQIPFSISQIGNVINSAVHTDTDYVSEGTEGYIGVTDTSAPRTISLRARCKDQLIYVSDESGGAGTNTITIDTVGAATINGQNSIDISENFGGYLFSCVDGVNFITLGATISNSPLPIEQGGTGANNPEDARVNLEITQQIPVGTLTYFPNRNGDAYLVGVWLKCDGSVISQATYSVLYDRMGLINPPGTNWTTPSSLNSAKTLLFSTVFVGAGNSGIIKYSTDAVTWTDLPSAITQTINSIIYSGSIYVAASSTGQIQTSTNLINWVCQNPSIGNGLNGYTPAIVWDGSQYVGCNSRGIMTSTDAITWNMVSGFSPVPFVSVSSVIYNSGIYVFPCSSGYLYTSTDLITFTSRTTGISVSSNLLSGLFAGGLYVVNTNVSPTGIITSTDAITWTTRTTTLTTGLAYNGTIYVAGGAGSTIYSSTDAITWTSSAAVANVFAIAWGTGIFVAVANGGLIRTSTDAVVWTSRTSGTATAIYCVTYANSLFLYGGANGVMATSTDGITWNTRTSGTTYNIRTVTFNTVWYAGTDSGLITSTDAITWTTITGFSATTSSINTLTYAASTYVFAGQGGVLKTSTDAHTWTARTSGTTDTINKLAYGTVFAYCDAASHIASSTDAITWVTQTTVTGSLRGLKYLNSNYLVGGSGGQIYTSTDATTWTARTSGTSSAINTFEFSMGYYVALGASTVALQSEDLITWNSNTAPAGVIEQMQKGNGMFVGVGATNVLVALDDYPYDSTVNFQLPSDNHLLITVESATNFYRGLYIKAMD